MWKHRNFINLQLCAGNIVATTINWDSHITKVVLGTIWEWTQSGQTDSQTGYPANDFVVTLQDGYVIDTVTATNGFTISNITDTTFHLNDGVDFMTEVTITITSKQSTPQPTLTFKHFYDAGTIGSGTYKFRHYSQQEPAPPTYAVTIVADGPRDSLCAYKLWSTADQANPTSGTMVYQNDGITDETVNVEVDKKYLVIVTVGNDGYRGANFETVEGGISKILPYVAEVTGQGTANISRWTCLTGDTLITLADLTQKRIDELALQDKVLAIDPETGKFVADEITYTDSTENKTFTEYDKWTFSDGTIVKTVHRHRFYNVEKQAMVYMDEWNIGEHAVNQNGEYIALVSHENVKEEVKHYTLFTKHQNYFANGLLSGNRYTAELHLKEQQNA